MFELLKVWFESPFPLYTWNHKPECPHGPGGNIMSEASKREQHMPQLKGVITPLALDQGLTNFLCIKG